MTTVETKQKYIGIKVNGMNHWIWFATANSKIENYRFIGTGGWGKGGAYTDIDIPTSQIDGHIYSENLQYS